MKLIHDTSLAATLNNITAAHLQGITLPQAQREQAAAWIAAKCGTAGSYRDLPAPTAEDYHSRLRLFTGEVIGSHAGTGCKLGFEATWAMTHLRPRAKAVVAAAEACRERTLEMFVRERARRQGLYCCLSCGVAGWRAMGAMIQHGQNAEQASRYADLAVGLLRTHRDGKGRWLKFPFWYSVLGICDLGSDAAGDELRYAAPSLQRFLDRKPAADDLARRRTLLAQYALARV